MTQPGLQHTAADGGLVEAGQEWAYRARQADDLVQVRVLRLGTQRPARVLVQFADEVFEGRQEWVPPARLKAHWQDVGQYRAREALWNRIHAAGLPPDDPAKTPPRPSSNCCSPMTEPRLATAGPAPSASATPPRLPPNLALTVLS